MERYDNNKGIFDAIDLANYLNYLHVEKYGINISPLKLQKVLFFLFGEWGAFIKKANYENDGKELVNYSKFLFDNNIEAWVYGPVVPDVYKTFNDEKNDGNNLFDTDEKKYIKHFIDDLSTELFELSDFRLVEITHQMKCWKDKFKSEEKYHNNIIDKEDIINEFIG